MLETRQSGLGDLHDGALPEALIFDFDGVIADTETLYWQAWHEILKAQGIVFEWEDYCRIGRGIRDEKMIESLAPLISDSIALERIKNSFSHRNEILRKWRQTRSLISDATIQLLMSLKGWTIGLVTSSDRSDIEPMLLASGIADRFNACVFGEEIAVHKPDPAPYLLIREKLGIRGGVAFEDSEPGLLSATRAGFKTIHVSSPKDLPRLVRELIGEE